MNAQTHRLRGRTAIKAAVHHAEPSDDPAVLAIAHVICSMGGHILHRDNEQDGACSLHVRQAVVALAQAQLAGSKR